jgi:hypothetical protein
VPSVEEQLARWRDAGLIDEEQVQRILAFETTPSGPGARPAAERPGLLETLLYLGIAVAVVGVFTLVAQNWDELRTWARIAVLAVPGTLLVLAGAAMRATDQPAVRRASGLAWLAAVAILAGAVGVAGNEAGWQGRSIWLTAGILASGLALVLWAVQPAHPQVIAVAGGLALLAGGTAQWTEGYEPETAGLLIAAFAAVALVLTELRLFGPAGSARLLGAAGVMAGLTIAAYATESSLWLESLVFIAGAALIAVGLRRSEFTYIAVAVAGLFLGLVLFIFRHFEDELGAPVALLLTGTFVIAAVLMLALLRRRMPAEAAR